MEEASEEKHDMINGVVYAVADVDIPHNLISSNTLGNVGQFLKDKNCRIYGSNLKVTDKTKSGFAYPDLTLICNGAQLFSRKNGIVTNPSVIIEVLSPATEAYDRGKKFMLYRQIETLQEYILISSMQVLVEKFIRHESGSWLMTEYKNFEDEISIDTISYRTKLTDLYRDVVFENIDDTIS